MPVELSIESIRTDGGTQPRAKLDCDAIDAYVEALESGAKFPPVDVFYDGTDYWLADGFHRIRAFDGAGKDDIPATVHQGGLEDARWFSYAANKTHGLYRSNEDKHRAVKAALKHPNGAKSSDSQIGKHVGVDHKTVAGWREKLFPSREIPKIRTVTRKGTTYQQDTANIGKPRLAKTPVRAATLPADPADDPITRTFNHLNETSLPVEEPFSIDAAIVHIMLDIMTTPLRLRKELIQALREILNIEETESEKQWYERQKEASA